MRFTGNKFHQSEKKEFITAQKKVFFANVITNCE
jgi:hypothetical protein